MTAFGRSEMFAHVIVTSSSHNIFALVQYAGFQTLGNDIVTLMSKVLDQK
jgi:hypothetical protein